MAQYNGYYSIAHSSYSEWKAVTLGNGYNVDASYGNQCWDYCAELWYQYGLTLYTGPGGNAKECWTVSRNRNARGPFRMVSGKENILKGDVLVFDSNTTTGTGHICFADEDYSEGMTVIKTLGQMPAVYGLNGTVHVDNFSLNKFLGIFRNSEWDGTPPSPTPATEWKEEPFPWPVAWEHWDQYKD